MWLYVGSLLFNLLGFFFWIVVSLFVSPQVVGSAAAVIALYSSFVAVLSLGIPMGVRRFMGSSWGDGDYQQLFSYFLTAFVLLTLVNLPLVVVALCFSTLSGILSLTSFEFFIVSVLLILEFWPPLFYSLFNSVLRTKTVAFADILLSCLKLLASVLLLSLGYGFLGLMLGLIVGSIVRSALFFYYTMKMFREHSIHVYSLVDMSKVREILPAGIASWAPTALAVLGQSIGVLAIYGFVGGTETGLYYIAFTIALVVYRLPDSIQTLMFPVVSGMSDGKKRAISAAIKLTLALTVPLALALVVYPFLPFMFLGPNYLGASNILRLLVLGAIIHPIISGYVTYIYAIGKYAHVMIVGLVTTMARLVLYALLVASMGAEGVAISFTLGMLISLALTIISARRIGFKFQWLQHGKTILVAVMLSVLLYLLNIWWLIGIPLLVLGSLVAYLRIGILSRSDIREISQAFLSDEAIARASARFRPILSLLFVE